MHPNEHAARQVGPGGFELFVRDHPVHWPAGVDALVGIGKVNVIQQVRFDAQKFDPPVAKAWLRGNGFRRDGFREATAINLMAREDVYVFQRLSQSAEMQSGRKDGDDVWFSVPVAKLDLDKKRVFGWLYVCRRKDGTIVVDHSGEIIKIAELEEATYGYVADHRVGANMHRKDEDGQPVQIGHLIECVCFTSEKRIAMGVPDGVLPDATWIGLQVTHDPTWAEFKSGKLKMFSLGGRALRSALKLLMAQRRAA